MEQRLEQKQTQRLSLSPQMQQAIYLLQLPLMELRQFLQQQLIQNPLLEEIEDESSSDDEEILKELRKDEIEPDLQEEMERLARFEQEWEEYFHSTTLPGQEQSDEEKEEYVKASITKPLSLQDHLLWQLHLMVLSPEERKIGETIIGNIDEDGYLQSSLGEIESDLGVSHEKVEKVLSIIHRFAPPGVGARSLKECLLLQLRSLGKKGTLQEKIIESHLEDLKRKRYKKILRNLGISTEEVNEAVKAIACLEPKPGMRISREDARPIVPDLIVKKVDDGYHIMINDEGLQRLRVSPFYRQLKGDGNQDPGARQYILEKFRAAKWIIKSIEQRRRTLIKVAECIVKKQKEFFDRGPKWLKPATMREIATEIGMHESTISRVTMEKYIDTPHGIFKLRHFFSGEVATDKGAISSRGVKVAIQKLIAEEDKHCPLSDEEITRKLQERGMHIARRTSAKYRRSLNILPSNLRKEL
ncbi:RNA polymerase sigma-54 factor [candidate division NPL-UPA2 bacterium Unc8]|uniref:RNA polymerase sigma-54 factor n=1 Tax=candidate division NPL-UPA2 bacterium Unc8 TaxID=1980939 RepID=A0A399FZD4_UNCN2|nr:MAG: RNA polymerase sigma-54 factor [candidate division NPL-UPA2 bacterium Unc8]